MKLSPALLVVWSAIVLWAAVSSFYPESNHDVWFHLRVGADVLENGAPHIERWSATAAGRPFIAHEWLAAALLERVAHATDGVGLTMLRVWIVALIVLCLWLAAPSDRRQHAFTPWLALIALLLIMPRAAARPHLFSLLFVALHVVAIEGWRQRRSYTSVLWLAPLIGLWANLHGAFLLGPVILLVAAAGAILSSVVPRKARDDEDTVESRPYALRDALPLVVTAALALLASLANPYGFDLFVFSFEMATGNEYIKSIINEWKPFWAEDHRRVYDAYLYPACLVLLWLRVLWRSSRHDLVDIALLVLATWLSWRAFRFAPYFALLGFPIAVRAYVPRLLGPPSFGIIALSALAPLVLFGFTAVHGPGHRLHVPLVFGAGLSDAPASALLRRARELDLEGVVLNEYEDGGLLLYGGLPKLRPVIDGRIDIYGEELAMEYLGAVNVPARTPAYLARYDVRVAILKKERAGVIEAILAQPGWGLVASDERRVLLVRYDETDKEEGR